MSDLVTGDAVVVELRLARIPSRTVALALDVLVLFAIGAVLVLGGAAAFGSVDDALGRALTLVMVVAVLVGVPVTFETLTRGRTLGKMAMGLRVVRDDGGPIGLRHALIRGLVGVVEIWLLSGAGAIVSSLVSSKGKRIGDLLAGTVVVRERMPAHGGAVAAMPPALAGWASGLDLSRLPDDLALAARQYVSRAGELSPGARESMGARLAAAVATVVSPPPPPGVPPLPYLSAVLAERRQREFARMAPAGPAGRPQAAAGYAGGGGFAGPGAYGKPGAYDRPGLYDRPGPYGTPGPYGPPAAAVPSPASGAPEPRRRPDETPAPSEPGTEDAAADTRTQTNPFAPPS